jgi:SNF2 family DNA or RNA helicase
MSLVGLENRLDPVKLDMHLEYTGRRLVLVGCDEYVPMVSARLFPGGVSFCIWDLLNFIAWLKDKGMDFIDASEEAFKVANSYMEFVERQRACKQRTDPIEVGDLVKTVPFVDQWNAIHFLLSRQFAGNWDTMGAGKTFVSIFSYAVVKRYGLAKSALVLCVNAAKSAWYDEVKKHSVFKVRVAGNGTKEVLNSIYGFDEEDFFVLHYDALINDSIFERLLRKRFDLIVIDEAHKIKNITAKRTKRVLDLVQAVKRAVPIDTEKVNELGMHVYEYDKPFVWCLTGTPVSERPSNAYTLLKILYGKMFDVSHRVFENFFCIFKELSLRSGKRIKVVAGYRHCDSLGRVLEPVSIGRKANELKGLPEKVVVDRVVEMSEGQKEVYEKVKKGLIEELKRMNRTIKLSRLENIFIRLHEVLSCPQTIGIEAPSIKHDVVLDMIEELEEPVLIWVIYRVSAEVLYNRLKNSGVDVELIYGGTDVDRIKKKVEDGKVHALIASIKKLGVSVDFLKAFRRAIYVDLPFSFTEYMQSQDRLVRRGVMSRAFLYRLIVKRSLDEYVCDILSRKEEMFKKASLVEDLEVDVDEVLRRI